MEKSKATFQESKNPDLIQSKVPASCKILKVSKPPHTRKIKPQKSGFSSPLRYQRGIAAAPNPAKINLKFLKENIPA